jgi:hypothetical protein
MTEYEMRNISARVLDSLGILSGGDPELARGVWRIPYVSGGIHRDAYLPDQHDAPLAEFSLRSAIVKAHQTTQHPFKTPAAPPLPVAG